MGTKTIMVEGRPVTVPDDITEDELATLLNGGPQAPPEKRNYALKDVPGEAAKNLGPSAGRAIEGVVHSATHPLDTIKDLLGLAATPASLGYYGILSGLEDLGYPKGTAAGFRKWALQPSLDYGQTLIDRWGGGENIKRTLAEDPVGAGMEVLGLTPIGPKLAKTAPVRAAGQLVDKGIRKAGQALVDMPVGAVEHLIETHEGIGRNATRDVFEAGREGKSVVRKAIKEGYDRPDILNRIYDAVDSLIEKRNREYNTRMRTVAGNDAPVDFSKIDQAIIDANEMGLYRGKSGTATPRDIRGNQGPNKHIDVHGDLNNIINEWKQLDPAEFHTAYGFDKMKQELNNYVNRLSPVDGMKTQAQAYAAKLMNAVRDTIREKAHPDYVKAMDDWGAAQDQIRGLKKEFKLGDKNTELQALNSLQQIYRRTAGVSHGAKENFLRTALKDAGENDLMQILAGSQFNPWTPHGLRGVAWSALPLALMTGHIPLEALALAPVASPRITGSLAYGAGKVAGGVDRAKRALPGIDPLKSGYDWLKWNADPTIQALTTEEPPEERARGGVLRRAVR